MRPSEVPGRRGPYRNGLETRARVVASATSVFGRHGYRGGTLQAVADEVGITPAAIIRLFGSKQSLLVAVMQAWADEVTRTLGSDREGLAYLSALPRIMVMHVQRRGLLELHATLSTEGADPDHPAHDYMVERYHRVRENIAHQLLAASATGDIAPLTAEEAENEATLLVAVMDGLQIQWLLDGSIDLGARFREHMATLLVRLRAATTMAS